MVSAAELSGSFGLLRRKHEKEIPDEYQNPENALPGNDDRPGHVLGPGQGT